MEADRSAIVLESATVLSLQPSDVLVFRTPDRLSSPQRDRIAAMMEEVFPAHESVILEGGQEIFVLRPRPGFLRRFWRRLRRG